MNIQQQQKNTDESQKMQNTAKPYFKVLFHQSNGLQKP